MNIQGKGEMDDNPPIYTRILMFMWILWDGVKMQILI